MQLKSPIGANQINSAKELNKKIAPISASNLLHSFPIYQQSPAPCPALNKKTNNYNKGKAGHSAFRCVA